MQGRADIRRPVTVLTGFLGSGKTTLLNRVLADPAMSRTAVVINEFGDVAIDHALTTASDDTILVLENGCLCCTVFGDLVQTMNRLYHAREAGEIEYDQVVIETSGLAEPAPILQAFLSEPTLEGLFRVNAVIATVDAVNYAATLADHAVSVRQIALADCLLVTKLDLVAASERARIKDEVTARLRALNGAAAIVYADDTRFDPIQLMRQAAGDPARAWADHAGAQEAHAHDEHDHDAAISTFTLIRETPLDRDALALLLSTLETQLGPALLRVKGLVSVAEDPDRPAVIQGAQHLLHNLTWLDAWPDADRRTRIVFITQGVPSRELKEMITLLERVAERTSAARRRAPSAQEA